MQQKGKKKKAKGKRKEIILFYKSIPCKDSRISS
jgi:hypothetical protein